MKLEAATGLKLLLLLVFVVLTNEELSQRLSALLLFERYLVLAIMLGVWVSALCALVCVAFCPAPWLRVSLALAIALSSFAGDAFQEISEGRLGFDNVLTLWIERGHWAAGFQQYASWLQQRPQP